MVIFLFSCSTCPYFSIDSSGLARVSQRAEEEWTDRHTLPAPGRHQCEWAQWHSVLPGTTPGLCGIHHCLLTLFSFLFPWPAQLPATASGILLFLFPRVTNRNLEKPLSRKGFLIKVDAGEMTNVRAKPHIWKEATSVAVCPISIRVCVLRKYHTLRRSQHTNRAMNEPMGGPSPFYFPAADGQAWKEVSMILSDIIKIWTKRFKCLHGCIHPRLLTLLSPCLWWWNILGKELAGKRGKIEYGRTCFKNSSFTLESFFLR